MRVQILSLLIAWLMVESVLAEDWPQYRGLNAAGLSAHRPARAPILALTDSLQTLRQLRIVRSVEPYFIGPFGDPEKTLTRALDMLRDAGRIKAGDKLVIISDVLTTDNERVDSIQLRTVR